MKLEISRDGLLIIIINHLAGLYILPLRWRKMRRVPSSERRLAWLAEGAPAVTESETGVAPRVAKFHVVMWERDDQPAVFSALTRAR